jgi:glyoxylase-like metal-dependent hydrolase (beta-lactamase superfamily II)
VLAEPGEWKWDGLQVQAHATPGHSDDGLSFVIADELVATGRHALPGRGRRR